MADSIRSIIAELLSNMGDERALPTALGKAAALSTLSSNDVLKQELQPIVKEIDRLQGSRPDYELAASLVCWQVAEGGPLAGLGGLTDQALRGHIAFLLGRSMLYCGYYEQAGYHLEEAERLFQDLGYREKLSAVLGTRGSLSLALGDTGTAFSLYRKAESLAQEFDDSLGEASAKYGLAQVLALRGEILSARTYYKRALELYRASGQPAEEFKCLVMLAQTFDDAKETREKADLLTEAVAVASSAAIDLSYKLQAMAKLGTLYVRLGDKRNAESILDEGLSLALDAGDRYFESFFALNLGSMFATLGRPSDARRLFVQSLSASKAVGDTEGVLLAERNIAMLKSKGTIIDSELHIHRVGTQLKPPDEPEPHLQQALDELFQEARRLRQSPDALAQLRNKSRAPSLPDKTAAAITEKVLDSSRAKEDPLLTLILLMLVKMRLPAGFDTRMRIVLLARIGSVAERLNQFPLALEAYDEARALAAGASLQDERLAVSTNLAIMLRRMGKTAESLAVFEGIIREVETMADPVMKAKIFTNAATAYSDIGQHQRSLELTEAAINLIKNHADEQELLLISSINAACSYSALGTPEEAERRFTAALALARNLRNAAQEAVCLGHLGSMRMKQGKVDSAVRLFGQAALQAEMIGDLWNAQHWYRDLGNLYLWTGSDLQAQGCFEKALAISRQVGDVRSAAAATLGLGVSSQGDDSLKHLLSAWKACDATGNTSLAIEVALHMAQAYMKRAVGLEEISSALIKGTLSQRLPENRLRDTEALKEARAWFNRARALAQGLPVSDMEAHILLSENELLRLEARSDEAMANCLSILKKSTDPLQRRNCLAGLAGIYFHDMKDPGRALPYFEEAITAQETINLQLPTAEHRIQHRNDTASLYLWAAECALDLEQTEKAFAICERSKNRELQRLWSYKHETPLRAPTLAQLARLLAGSSSAVIQIIPSILKTYVFLLVPGMDKDREILALDTVTLSKITNWYMRMLRAYSELSTPAAVFDSDIETRWVEEVDAVCSEVGRELLEPIHKVLTEAALTITDVTFIPYGLLHSIPLHAAKISDDTYWIDHYQVSYSPSASLLTQIWSNPEPVRCNFVGFADATGDLPMARAEIASAAKEFAGNVKVLMGTEASKREVLRQLGKADWIHIACHGKLSFGDPSASGIVLASSVEDQDAFLDLQEINQRGQLVEGSVVILSACETGTIMPYFSDEYISLAAGFISAGASSIISTYWKVKDTCALLMMSRLYEALGTNNQTLCEALRSAMFQVRDLNEQEAYSALASAMESFPEAFEDVSEEILQPFAEQRANVRPFSHVADWGAFQLVGWGRKPISRVEVW